MKTAVISGATSMIGVATIKACLAQDVSVIALVRKGSTRLNRLPKDSRIRVVNCSLEDMANYAPHEMKADVFFHFAWASTLKSGGRFDADAQEPNIRYTLDAVHLAKRFGCKKFVGAGSQAEYGLSDKKLAKDTSIRPYMAYGVAKYAAGKLAEILCEKESMDFAWGRILSVYGPHDNEQTLLRYLIQMFEEGKSPALTPCEQIWDYLYEDDAGEAFYAIGFTPEARGVYCVGSGEGHPLRDFVLKIREAVGTEVKPIFGAKAYGKNQVMFLQADIGDLTKTTGWKPRVSFVDGIRSMIAEWHHAHSGGGRRLTKLPEYRQHEGFRPYCRISSIYSGEVRACA